MDQSVVQFRLKKLGQTHCLCCGVEMVAELVNGSLRRSSRTRGHLVPSTFDPPRFWVYQCNRCNISQGSWTIEEWLVRLQRGKDRRAANVAALVAQLHEMGIFELMRAGRLGISAGS